MFEQIIKLIENNEFESALNTLDGVKTSGDPKAEAKVNYLLGYIHTCREFKNKKDYLAKRYLLSNINSGYPQPNAYVLYARVEDDKNVAINYLLKGSLLFQGDPRIYLELFRQTTDKDNLVEKIQNEDFSDFKLITEVIEYLIKKHEWAKIESFIFRLQNNDTITDYDNNYLDLLKAYSHIFREEPNYEKSIGLFKKVIDADIDNNLAYSHYLGIIYAYINTGDIAAATLFFDKLPTDNSIHDLDDGPWCTICIDFDLEYKAIFQQIIATYTHDSGRKQKAKCLYSLYLYYPSVIYDKFRYKKEHIKPLQRDLKIQFNAPVAAALFNMYCHFKQYIDANNAFFEFLTHYENPDDMYIDYSCISDNANENDLQQIVQNIVVAAGCDSGFDNKIFIRTLFKELVDQLFSSKQYSLVVKMADVLSLKEICNSECAFECAYSYAEVNSDNAQAIYEDIIKKEQKNSSAINNLVQRSVNE
jgi:tetratricopeptide (TPR) repeat protein